MQSEFKLVNFINVTVFPTLTSDLRNDNSNIQYKSSTEYGFYFLCFAHIDDSADVINLREQFRQCWCLN